MSAWHTRTYTDPATGEVVARYVSLDGELWMQALTDDDVVNSRLYFFTISNHSNNFGL